MDGNTWISVEVALPSKFMKVEWLCEDGNKDVGFWDGNNFKTWDLITDKPITHWKPLPNPPPQKNPHLVQQGFSNDSSKYASPSHKDMEKKSLTLKYLVNHVLKEKRSRSVFILNGFGIFTQPVKP